MIKLIEKITLCALIITGISACIKNQYVEYKPHYLNEKNEHKFYGEPELDSITFQNTIQVLDYYEEDYKTKDRSVILISKQLSKDWELLWNYTTKAGDDDWLRTHKKE